MAPNWTYMIDNLLNGDHAPVKSSEKEDVGLHGEYVDKSRPHGESSSSTIVFMGVTALLGLCLWQVGAVETVVSGHTLEPAEISAMVTENQPTTPLPPSPYLLACLAGTVNALIIGAVWFFCLRPKPTPVRTARDIPTQDTPYGSDDIQRQMAFPPPYPNSWYKLCSVSDLKNDDVLHVEACGLNLAVFRGESGEVYVLDAFCPHLGANMAEGGKVKGDNLECPFHQWQFRGSDGRTQHIPYTTAKIPDYARVKKYPSCVRYQMVLFYYDADGCDEPPYMPPAVEGVTDGKFIHRGTHNEVVRMHIYDFAENSADTAHFSCLHGRMMLPWTKIQTPFTINHVAGWELDPHHKWMMYFTDKANLVFRGKHLQWTEAFARITFVGPGGVVHFRFTLPGLGEIVMFQTHTPVKPMVLRAEFSWWADPCIPRVLVWYVIGNWISQWGEDIRVWENKLLLNRPLLVRGDGPIMKLRRWYKQFLVPASYQQQAHFEHASRIITPPNLGAGNGGKKADDGVERASDDLGDSKTKEPAACFLPDW